MSADTGLVPVEKSPVAFGARGIELRSLEDAWRMATAIVKSGLAPKGINSPEAALVAIQSGMELGMTCMQSLQNLTVINGKIGITGDAAMALVRSSGLLETWREFYEGDGDTYAHVIVSKRRGEAEPYRSEFSVADAKRARLHGKQGPWTEYMPRMLRYRNLGFHLRDYYGEPLKGFKTTEELFDYPPAAEKNVTPIRPVESEEKPTPKLRNAITDEQIDAIIREAWRAGVVANDVSIAHSGISVMDLSSVQAQRFIGHLKTLPAATVLAQPSPAAGSEDAAKDDDLAASDEPMPFDQELPADLDQEAKDIEAFNRREAEGHQLAVTGGVERDAKGRCYHVKSGREKLRYKVTKPGEHMQCSCPDYKFNSDGKADYFCKHIFGVIHFKKAEELPLERITKHEADNLRAAFQSRGVPPAEWLQAHGVESGLCEDATAEVMNAAFVELFN